MIKIGPIPKVENRISVGYECRFIQIPQGKEKQEPRM